MPKKIMNFSDAFDIPKKSTEETVSSLDKEKQRKMDILAAIPDYKREYENNWLAPTSDVIEERAISPEVMEKAKAFLDPHNPNLTPEQKAEIIERCRVDPEYFNELFSNNAQKNNGSDSRKSRSLA